MKRIKIPTTRALSFLMAMLMLIGLCLTACTPGTGEDSMLPHLAFRPLHNPPRSLHRPQDALVLGSPAPAVLGFESLSNLCNKKATHICRFCFMPPFHLFGLLVRFVFLQDFSQKFFCRLGQQHSHLHCGLTKIV